MIYFRKGDMFEVEVEALVNTVNTVGNMGKGLALAFKNKFPENNGAYIEACKNNQVRTGEMFVVEAADRGALRYIVNFPTKQHWRNPSQMLWVEQGLASLREFITNNDIKSIAIPALGAGLGGLNWLMVKDAIQNNLGDMDGVDIFVFEPL